MDDATERPELERGTGFLLARLGSLAARSWQAFLAERRLTQIQYATLMVLAEYRSLGQLRLAQLVAVDPRNLVAVLDQLGKRGLIVRETDAADRRRRNVRLTATGTALVLTLADDTAASRDQFLGSLNVRQRKQLNVLLHQLYEAHGDEHEQTGEPRAPAATPLAKKTSPTTSDRQTPRPAKARRASRTPRRY